MPERLTVLDERYSQFKPASPEVQKFRSENPDARWETLLEHMLEDYDPKKWRLEGSAAVALYHPRQIIPKDIDIFTQDEYFAEQFGFPPDQFDVRTTEFWLRMRGLPINKKSQDYLMSATFVQRFRGKGVLVSAPSVIAFSKTYTYDTKAPRPKDIEHLAIMRVKKSAIERVHRKLLAA